MGTDPPAGVLRVDKPPGPTSHDVVAVARRALMTRRVGHTGTLDPFASGLLILCLGWATRLAEYLAGLSKSYQAVMKLGEETDTHDRTGAVVARSDRWRGLSQEQVAAALERRSGPQLQVPPLHSAKKLAGERLYAKARRGELVTPQPVAVSIENICLTGWDPPCVSFETTCSSGTYVRAIARDVGLDLNSFAHLMELRRTAVGQHAVTAALSLRELQLGNIEGHLLDAVDALPHLPRLPVDDAAATDIRHGRTVPAPAGLTASVILILWRDRLLAVGSAGGGRLHPEKVFDA